MVSAGTKWLVTMAAAAAMVLACNSTAMAGGACGDAADQERVELNRISMGARQVLDGCPFEVSASDSFEILRASVGADDCDGCVCDVDSSGAVSAVDSLIALYCSIGIHVPAMQCEPCG